MGQKNKKITDVERESRFAYGPTSRRDSAFFHAKGGKGGGATTEKGSVVGWFKDKDRQTYKKEKKEEKNNLKNGEGEEE